MIIIILFALVAAGALVYRWADDVEWRELLGGAMLILFGLLLLLATIILPFSRMESTANIRIFTEVQRTIDSARDNPAISAIELAALQQKVVEMNQLLVYEQYWASSFLFGIYHNSKVLLLEPIR